MTILSHKDTFIEEQHLQEKPSFYYKILPEIPLTMLGKAANQQQLELFKATLKQIIDPKHPLVILAQHIP